MTRTYQHFQRVQRVPFCPKVYKKKSNVDIVLLTVYNMHALYKTCDTKLRQVAKSKLILPVKVVVKP